jgi:hypothetical protein
MPIIYPGLRLDYKVATHPPVAIAHYDFFALVSYTETGRAVAKSLEDPLAEEFLRGK